MAEICVQGVRDCDVYVALIRSNHGSGVLLRLEERTQASFFELELFEAALQKPAYVFMLDGGEPLEQLAGLLDLLRPALPGFDGRARSEAEIFDRVRAILDATSHPRRRPALLRKRASARQISNSLTGARFHRYDPTASAPQLRFLGGAYDPSLPRPNLDLTRDAIRLASGQVQPQRSADPAVDRAPGTDGVANRGVAAPRGRRPLGAGLGRMEQRGSLVRAARSSPHGVPGRPRFPRAAAPPDLQREESPHGAMSSEYYSIAKLVSRPDLKSDVLAASRAHIDAAFLTGENSGKACAARQRQGRPRRQGRRDCGLTTGRSVAVGC